MLIIRRSDCINTACGIVFSVSDRPVCRSCTPDGHLQSVKILDAVLIQFDLLMMKKSCLEHVEDYNNKRII